MSIRNALNLLTARYEALKTKKLTAASIIDQIQIQFRRIFETEIPPEVNINVTSQQDASADSQHPYRVGFGASVIRSENPIVSYTWSSTGATGQSGQSVLLEWATSGSKRVTLNVTDSAGKNYTFTYDITLAAQDAPPQNPVQSFGITADPPIANTFTGYVHANVALNSGSVTSYDWFVDGTLVAPNAGANPLLNYGRSGQVPISCTITLSDGSQRYANASVNVPAQTAAQWSGTLEHSTAPDNAGGFMLTATANFTSNKGSITNYAFSAGYSGNGNAGSDFNSNSDTFTFYGAFPYNEDINLSVRMTDSAGNTFVTSKVVRVNVYAPITINVQPMITADTEAFTLTSNYVPPAGSTTLWYASAEPPSDLGSDSTAIGDGSTPVQPGSFGPYPKNMHSKYYFSLYRSVDNGDGTTTETKIAETQWPQAGTTIVPAPDAASFLVTTDYVAYQNRPMRWGVYAKNLITDSGWAGPLVQSPIVISDGVNPIAPTRLEIDTTAYAAYEFRLTDSPAEMVIAHYNRGNGGNATFYYSGQRSDNASISTFNATTQRAAGTYYWNFYYREGNSGPFKDAIDAGGSSGGFTWDDTGNSQPGATVGYQGPIHFKAVLIDNSTYAPVAAPVVIRNIGSFQNSQGPQNPDVMPPAES